MGEENEESLRRFKRKIRRVLRVFFILRVLGREVIERENSF